MNTKKHMIIIKGEIKTSAIKFCKYNAQTKKMDIEYTNGKLYSYAYSNVEWIKEPQALNPKMYQISKAGRVFYDIEAIYVFRGAHDTFWHICFNDGIERDYLQSELKIVQSCLSQSQSQNVFEYMKQIAGLSNLKNEETGEKILAKRFAKISFIGEDVALANYLNPAALQQKNARQDYVPIFPFGCNNSQYKAVKMCIKNSLPQSIIWGLLLLH